MIVRGRSPGHYNDSDSAESDIGDDSRPDSPISPHSDQASLSLPTTGTSSIRGSVINSVMNSLTSNEDSFTHIKSEFSPSHLTNSFPHYAGPDLLSPDPDKHDSHVRWSAYNDAMDTAGSTCSNFKYNTLAPINQPDAYSTSLSGPRLPHFDQLLKFTPTDQQVHLQPRSGDSAELQAALSLAAIGTSPTPRHSMTHRQPETSLP